MFLNDYQCQPQNSFEFLISVSCLKLPPKKLLSTS
jgi:hypothetical protein